MSLKEKKLNYLENRFPTWEKTKVEITNDIELNAIVDLNFDFKEFVQATTDHIE